MPSNPTGVSKTVLDSWCVRDFGLRYDELRALIGLRMGSAPQKGLMREHYFARVMALLPTYAKGRGTRQLEKYVRILVWYLHEDAV